MVLSFAFLSAAFLTAVQGQTQTQQPTSPVQPAPVKGKEASGSSKTLPPDRVRIPLNPKQVIADLGGGRQILLSELLSAWRSLPKRLKDMPLDQIYEMLIRRLIDSKIIYFESIEQKLHKNDEFVKKFKELSAALVQKMCLEHEIEKVLKEEDVRKKYQELLALVPKGEMEINLKMILVAAIKEAQDIIKKLNKGESFEKFIELSKHEMSKKNKGDLGYLRKADLPKAQADLIMNTKEGSCVSTPIEVPGVGFAVFKVGGKRPIQPPKYEDVREELKKLLIPTKGNEVLEALRKTHVVQKFDLEGKPLGDKEKIPAVPTDAIEPTKVLAEMKGGRKITWADFKKTLETLPANIQGAPISELYVPLLTRVIDTVITETLSKEGKWESHHDYLLKRSILWKNLLEKFYYEQTSSRLVTPDLVRSQFAKLVERMPKDGFEIRVRHIMVASLTEAQSLLKELKAGASFDSLLSHSIDDRTKDKGGDLGYLTKDRVKIEVWQKLMAAAPGSLIPEPVEIFMPNPQGIETRYHTIMRVEDKRPVEPPKFQEVQEALTQRLKAQFQPLILNSLKEKKYKHIKAYRWDGSIMPLPMGPAAEEEVASTQGKAEAPAA